MSSRGEIDPAFQLKKNPAEMAGFFILFREIQIPLGVDLVEELIV